MKCFIRIATFNSFDSFGVIAKCYIGVWRVRFSGFALYIILLML